VAGIINFTSITVGGVVLETDTKALFTLVTLVECKSLENKNLKGLD
jgi:hypothetical protein